MRNKAIALTLGAAALVGAAALMQPVTANAAKPAQPKVSLAGLTWESSLQDALTKASLENKPVLHLQMFGKLDDAFC